MRDSTQTAAVKTHCMRTQTDAHTHTHAKAHTAQSHMRDSTQTAAVTDTCMGAHTHTHHLSKYLLRQLQLGAVGALLGLQTHQVGHGGIQEVAQRGGQDGHVHMLPLEREEQGGDALCHRHQTLVVCEERVGGGVEERSLGEKKQRPTLINESKLNLRAICGGEILS